MKHFWENNKHNVWFWLFVLLAIGLAILMPLMSIDAGNSGDEDAFQIPQGRNIVNYYKTGGEDTTCLTFQNLKYYGSSPDVIAEYINQKLEVQDIHITRHILNSLIGWLGILAIGLIAYLLGGARAGVFAMLLLFLSPRYLGHSFNNPKDIPFAAAMACGIYGILLFLKQFPKVKWYSFVILILSIAFAISIRIGGIILFGYFGLFAFILLVKMYADKRKELISNSNKKRKYKTSDWLSLGYLWRMLAYGIGICVIGYFLGILLWPYALQAPLSHPYEAYTEMAFFNTGIKQIFNGSMWWSYMLPWYYIPKLIIITTPLAIFIGSILYFFFGGMKEGNRLGFSILLFAFLFPIVWIIYTKANLYTGWRHVLFSYPPLVAIAGLGFDGLLTWIENRWGTLKGPNKDQNIQKSRNKIIIINIIGGIVFLTMMYHPIHHIIYNHPYEYVYFNGISGGMKNAYGNYEMDYYDHSERAAVEWLLQNALPVDSLNKNPLRTQNNKIVVAAWHTSPIEYFMRKDTANYQVVFTRYYSRGDVAWDYAIFPVTGMETEEIQNRNIFPPLNCIHVEEVDGYPICIVLQRENWSDYWAKLYQNKLFAHGNLDPEGMLLKDTMLSYAYDAFNYNCYDQSVIDNILDFFGASHQFDSVKKYVDWELSYLPRHDYANFMLGSYYLNNQQDIEGLKALKKCLKNDPRYEGAIKKLYKYYMAHEDYQKAERLILQLIDADMFYDQNITQLVEIYQKQGMGEASAYKRAFKNIYQYYEAHFGRHRQKECDFYKRQYESIKIARSSR